MRPEPVTRRVIDALSLSHKAAWGYGRLTGDSVPTQGGRAAFYRMIWEQAARASGGTVRALGDSVMEILCGDVRIRVTDTLTSLDDPVTLRVAGNKPVVHALLAERGIPVPRHGVCRVDDLPRAWRFTAEQRAPVVVKPARGTGAGDGVTAGIGSRLGLAGAMARAGVFCPDVVVEEQVQGQNYRLLYLDGDLLDAVRRDPPSVRGDGRSTLRQLIGAENRDRGTRGIEASQSLVHIDWEVKQTLRANGYKLRSVPPAGERVCLKTVVSDNRRDDNHPAAGVLSPSIVEVGAAAAAAVGVRLAGVDVVTTEAGVPLARSGGAVIEVNTTPSFYYHYMTSAEPVPVAALALERLLRGGR
jgi:D-alanine-D-alanine ligase-like ATP-grasp enzyme